MKDRGNEGSRERVSEGGEKLNGGTSNNTE